MTCFKPPNESRKLLSIAIAVIAFASCSDPQVVATVGDTKVTHADWALAALQRGAEADQGILDELVSREVLAEGARKSGLDKDAKVRARLAAAAREILAEAYLDQELARSLDEGALRHRYEDTKSEFTRTRVHARHLSLRPAPGAETTFEARLSALTAKWLTAEDREEVVKAAQADSGFIVEWRDPGPLLEGDVDQDYFEAARVLAPGQASKPVRTRLAAYLLEGVEASRLETPVFESIKGKLAVHARRDAEQQLLDRLRKSIHIKKRIDRELP